MKIREGEKLHQFQSHPLVRLYSAIPSSRPLIALSAKRNCAQGWPILAIGEADAKRP